MHYHFSIYETLHQFYCVDGKEFQRLKLLEKDISTRPQIYIVPRVKFQVFMPQKWEEYIRAISMLLPVYLLQECLCLLLSLNDKMIIFPFSKHFNEQLEIQVKH